MIHDLYFCQTVLRGFECTKGRATPTFATRLQRCAIGPHRQVWREHIEAGIRTYEQRVQDPGCSTANTGQMTALIQEMNRGALVSLQFALQELIRDDRGT